MIEPHPAVWTAGMLYVIAKDAAIIILSKKIARYIDVYIYTYISRLQLLVGVIKAYKSTEKVLKTAVF